MAPQGADFLVGWGTAAKSMTTVEVNGLVASLRTARGTLRAVESMCVAPAATSWVGIMRLVRSEGLKHKGKK